MTKTLEREDHTNVYKIATPGWESTCQSAGANTFAMSRRKTGISDTDTDTGGVDGSCPTTVRTHNIFTESLSIQTVAAACRGKMPHLPALKIRIFGKAALCLLNVYRIVQYDRYLS